jgi:hypothetical protein
MRVICTTAQFLFILFLATLLVPACSSSRYTGFKSYQSSSWETQTKIPDNLSAEISGISVRQPEQVNNIPGYFEILNAENHSLSLLSDKTDPVFDNKKALEKKKGRELRKVQKEERKMLRRGFDGIKYNRLIMTYAVGSSAIWFAGFVLVGVGAFIHFFLGAALIFGLFSLLKGI